MDNDDMLVMRLPKEAKRRAARLLKVMRNDLQMVGGRASLSTVLRVAVEHGLAHLEGKYKMGVK